MAWTVAKTNTVFGDMRAVIMSCSADAVTQSVETGLSRIIGFSIAPISMTSFEAINCQMNAGAEGTSIAGTLGLSSFTATDECIIVVYGK